MNVKFTQAKLKLVGPVFNWESNLFVSVVFMLDESNSLHLLFDER